MRLVQFRIKDLTTRIGVLFGENVVEISGTGVPNSLVEFLGLENALDKLKQ